MNHLSLFLVVSLVVPRTARDVADDSAIFVQRTLGESMARRFESSRATGGRRIVDRMAEAPPPRADLGGSGRRGGDPAKSRSSKVRVIGDLVRFGTAGLEETKTTTKEACDEFPGTCEPPFTCEGHGQSRRPHRTAKLATEDGHANIYSWCGYSQGYLRYAQQCAAGNLFQAAKELRKVQSEPRRPDGSFPLLTMDAAYCFAAGHCSDTNVTLRTTLMQAEALCDAKYSRKAWTGVRAVAMAASPKRRGTDSSWAKVACAMGTYHCDIVYCRVHYCKDATWKARFGHLA